MNLQSTLTKQDLPKLAAIGVALFSFLGGVRFATGHYSAKQERETTIKQINLEMGRGPDADSSEMPEEQPGQGDPNFVW